MFKRNVGSKQKILQVDIAKDRQGHKFYFYSEIKDTPSGDTLSITRAADGATNSIGKKEGISGRSGLDTGATNSLTNSVVKILGNVKTKMGQKNSVSIEEVLKQAGYKVPVILNSKDLSK